MKTIQTLIPDIRKLLETKDGSFTDLIARSFSDRATETLKSQFNLSTERPTLRLSQMGPRCPCALWHSIHHPELREALPPWAEVKFAFGHIVEGLAIALAKAAGHRVEGEQDAIQVDGVTGHRDCVIDGCIVDVKSSSSRSFGKFKDGSIKEDDVFGYLDQLDGYLCGSLDDPLVTEKEKAYLFVIDKQLGHMVLYEHRFRENSIRSRIDDYKRIISRSSPPDCRCGTKADGKSGNVALDVRASYSPYKFCCFPALRTFLYAKGPVYLTHVARKPVDVPEIDRYGNFVQLP